MESSGRSRDSGHRETAVVRKQWSSGSSGHQDSVVVRKQQSSGTNGHQETVIFRKQWSSGNSGDSAVGCTVYLQIQQQEEKIVLFFFSGFGELRSSSGMADAAHFTSIFTIVLQELRRS